MKTKKKKKPVKKAKKYSYKIITTRSWDLKINRSGGMIQITEFHEGTPSNEIKPYIMIPNETIDEVLKVLKALKKVGGSK